MAKNNIPPLDRYLWRPLMTGLKQEARDIADKLNETSMLEYDETDVLRIALREFYERAFGEFPVHAQAKVKPYHRDPGTVRFG